MVETGHQNNGLYSRFGTNPDLGELVIFVAKMPAAIDRSGSGPSGAIGSRFAAGASVERVRRQLWIQPAHDTAMSTGNGRSKTSERSAILEMLQELVDLCRLVPRRRTR